MKRYILIVLLIFPLFLKSQIPLLKDGKYNAEINDIFLKKYSKYAKETYNLKIKEEKEIFQCYYYKLFPPKLDNYSQIIIIPRFFFSSDAVSYDTTKKLIDYILIDTISVPYGIFFIKRKYLKAAIDFNEINNYRPTLLIDYECFYRLKMWKWGFSTKEEFLRYNPDIVFNLQEFNELMIQFFFIKENKLYVEISVEGKRKHQIYLADDYIKEMTRKKYLSYIETIKSLAKQSNDKNR